MPHSNSCSAGWFAARTMTVPIIKNMPRGFEESRGGDTEERREGQVEKLMKNWPFEFINFSDPSLVLARAVQYRDDNGLDGPSLLAIVDRVEKAVKEANPNIRPSALFRVRNVPGRGNVAGNMNQRGIAILVFAFDRKFIHVDATASEVSEPLAAQFAKTKIIAHTQLHMSSNPLSSPSSASPSSSGIAFGM